VSNELRPFIAADVLRQPADRKPVTQHLDHIGGLEATANLQGKKSAREFVDHQQQLQRPPSLGSICREVITPHMVPAISPLTDTTAPAVSGRQTTSAMLFLWICNCSCLHHFGDLGNLRAFT